jgi:hypothetical protein
MLAWVIMKISENSLLSPWRLLFLVEGFPSVLIAVWAWDFVPDGPGTANWLSPRQREVAVLRLRHEKEAEEEERIQEKYRSETTNRRGIDFREVLQTFIDPKCYLTAVSHTEYCKEYCWTHIFKAMFFSCNVAFSSMPVFLPSIIRDMGYSATKAQALSAPPYLFAFMVVITTAYLSDRYETRSIPIILHSLLAALGYTTIALCGHYQSTDTTIRYLALYPATAGFFSAITIIITWTINNQESDSKKGTGMAVLNVIGQIGPLVGTSIFPEEDGPWYVKGMTICAAFMLAVGVLAAILRIVLNKQNAKLRRGKGFGVYAGVPLEEGGAEGVQKKPFVFML